MEKKKQNSETSTSHNENTEEDDEIIDKEVIGPIESLGETQEETTPKQIEWNKIKQQWDNQLDPGEVEEQIGDQLRKSVIKKIIQNRRGRPKKVNNQIKPTETINTFKLTPIKIKQLSQ